MTGAARMRLLNKKMSDKEDLHQFFSLDGTLVHQCGVSTPDYVYRTVLSERLGVPEFALRLCTQTLPTPSTSVSVHGWDFVIRHMRLSFSNHKTPGCGCCGDDVVPLVDYYERAQTELCLRCGWQAHLCRRCMSINVDGQPCCVLCMSAADLEANSPANHIWQRGLEKLYDYYDAVETRQKEGDSFDELTTLERAEFYSISIRLQKMMGRG